MRTYCLAIVVLSVTLAAQPSSKFRQVDSYITNGVRNAAMFNFQPRIPSTVAERSLTGGVGATLTFTSAMGGCPWGVNGSDTSHSLYISGGTGTAEAVTITGGTCVAGATSGTITFTPANTHSGQWTIRSATGGVREALQDLPSDGGSVLASNLGGVTMRGDPLGGVTKPFALILSSAGNLSVNISTDVTWNITRSGQKIIGQSERAIAIFTSSSFTASSPFTITDCTNATPIVCTTSASHGYSSGGLVHIYSVGGNTAANGSWDLSAVTATTLTLRGSVGSGAYTSGGSVIKVTPVIKILNTDPIFSAEVSGITIGCSTDGLAANVRAGCAGIYASGLQNQSKIEDVWVYGPTSGFWLNTGTNNNTSVEMNRLQTVGIATGFVGFMLQAELLTTRSLVCDAENLQGQTCVRWLSTGTVLGILAEETTDVVYQSPNTSLNLFSVRGVDHDGGVGKDVINVFHTATKEYLLADIVATQVSGTTPTIILDDATPYTVSGVGSIPWLMNGTNGATFPSTVYFGLDNFGAAGDERARIIQGVDTDSSIQIRSLRPGGPTGGKGWLMSPGGTGADANPTMELGSCDADFTTNCHTYFKASVNGGTGYNVNLDPDGTENVNVGGTLKMTKGILLASKMNAQLGAEGNGTLFYCSDCTIANPCAGGGTGALAKKIAGAWVCN